MEDTHVKFLAFDLLSLTPSSSTPNSTAVRRISTATATTVLHLSRAETLGIITSRHHKPDRFLRFTIDDGTGCVPCVLWLNHLTSAYFSRRSPPDLRSIAGSARRFETLVQIGASARVRGKVSFYRGEIQLTVSNVFIERDPNAEILHWLQCVRLARNRYDVVVESDDDDKMLLPVNKKAKKAE
ncbi:hypothetical protein OSB04_022730 [Centaurea solstitialis]|uniref:CST complex subunit STN1 n=1 Tax=Centaurea solstitialis TaxID=347529 RepID=A0AA38T2J1_9ASTR|nr:hypothetical protein OSB04_022730 [Centaurea solstitialis]